MTDVRPLISVIIPAYNEQAHITATLHEVIAYLEGLDERYRWEIVVVDDGSSDGTLEAIRAVAETEPRLRAAPQPSNFNLGQSLRYGFSMAEGDYLVTLDADLSYSPDHIGRLIEVLDSTEAKVVIASPYMDGGEVTGVPTSRLVASKAANRLLSGAAKGDLTTVTGMVRGYDAVFLESLDLKAMDAEINAEIIYKAQLMRAKIVEIPAHLEWTRDDDVKRPFRPSRSVAGFTFVSFLFRPYVLFMAPAAALFALAVILWVAVVLVDDTSTSTLVAIAAATSTVVAVTLGGMGVLSAQAKRYFEELFHLGTSAAIRERRRARR